ncbi:ACP phosphodiesterase [Immundisolibacter sp.]|uniref:acyl carrier protein phosphodiesterase n=1 Tax=Immundisolibacter sp. TaxID=1934948 RepID=UPI0026383BFB|nr:ACP phosphodiesterase [Immundisolibacter sp.]MDD3651102.1 ACP phosphodiesterase [Immundisolibacter sp.]
MNVLAHALLARQAGCSLIGNLLGDFVRGAPPAHWPPAWRDGIRLHRRIDGFVDRHVASARSVARLPAGQRRWARVALDVYYDHLLARHWADHADLPLPRFAGAVYAELEAQRAVLPSGLVRFADFMADRDLLVGYREPAVIADVLARLAGRARRNNPLAQAFPALCAADAGLAVDFGVLFPAALAFARAEVAARAPQAAA